MINAIDTSINNAKSGRIIQVGNSGMAGVGKAEVGTIEGAIVLSP